MGRYNRRGNNQSNDNNAKRSKFDDSRHYKKFHISKLPANVDQPGSYTRLFDSSFAMVYKEQIPTIKEKEDKHIIIEQDASISNKENKEIKEETSNSDNNNNNLSLSKNDDANNAVLPLTQIVHVHVNGLCIITAGDNLVSHILQKQSNKAPEDKQLITKIEYLVKNNPDGVGGKNKKKIQAQIVKKAGGKIHPFDPLVKITLWDESIIKLYSCVLGTLIEYNERLVKDPSLLITDPLGSGYLAIFLPLGTFPPDGLSDTKKVCDEKMVTSIDNVGESLVTKEEEMMDAN